MISPSHILSSLCPSTTFSLFSFCPSTSLCVILTQAAGEPKIKMAAHLLTHIYFCFGWSSLFFLLWLFCSCCLVLLPSLIFFIFSLWLIYRTDCDRSTRVSPASESCLGFSASLHKRPGDGKSPRMIHYCQFSLGLLCHIFEFFRRVR